MVLSLEGQGLRSQNETPSHDPIFDPPQDAIARILPLLVDERELRILGHSVFANNLFYDLGDGRIVKTGVNVSVNEAKAMVFVRQNTTIPVPEVYMVFQHDGATCIVMELVGGVALREAVDHDETGSYNPSRPLVTEAQVLSIMQQLKGFIAELRDLGRRFPQNKPQFGSWPDGPYRTSYFYGAFPTTPFTSVDEFHAYFLDRLRLLTQEQATYDLLDQEKARAENEDVDWETFGWYPEFWEYMGIGNEVMGRVISQAIRSVFGEMPPVSETYRYVHTCLTLHDFY
ncbi:kinase-like protein [Lentinus tigrinus ALCF2SS1-7]|uniref:Kinase-like protein n=1 Tax=Lentinus tigrinus ALCF2SS1-6 TaxID=1328759 RepID=A0A5C2RPN4_9APHY|nr:kinase-like protein [Lentinus tigrinus ALCF2SS1-6]RPD67928.1 kinase-like protein [Lentinus tigrinus ALCF2SS1-7]